MINGLEQLIGTLGFPVAIAAFLLYERAIVRKENREDKNKTIETVTNALNNNTEALAELKTIIQEKLE